MQEKNPFSPTERFTSKVNDYQRYRPGYPDPLFETLGDVLNPEKFPNVADIGSGTGIFSKYLLDRNYSVFAVEPNAGMREAAEHDLKDNPKFHSVNGSSEETHLPDHQMDWIVAATAFHWFELVATKREFHRILKPNGFVALVWNIRRPDADAFSVAYETLWKEHGTSEKKDLQEKDINYFFSPAAVRIESFPQVQTFDLAGLIGRSFSSSFSPSPDSPEGLNFINNIQKVFEKYQRNETVTIQYETKLYLSRI